MTSLQICANLCGRLSGRTNDALQKCRSDGEGAFSGYESNKKFQKMASTYGPCHNSDFFIVVYDIWARRIDSGN